MNENKIFHNILSILDSFDLSKFQSMTFEGALNKSNQQIVILLFSRKIRSWQHLDPCRRKLHDFIQIRSNYISAAGRWCSIQHSDYFLQWAKTSSFPQHSQHTFYHCKLCHAPGLNFCFSLPISI